MPPWLQWCWAPVPTFCHLALLHDGSSGSACSCQCLVSPDAASVQGAWYILSFADWCLGESLSVTSLHSGLKSWNSLTLWRQLSYLIHSTPTWTINFFTIAYCRTPPTQLGSCLLFSLHSVSAFVQTSPSLSISALLVSLEFSSTREWLLHLHESYRMLCLRLFFMIKQVIGHTKLTADLVFRANLSLLDVFYLLQCLTLYDLLCIQCISNVRSHRGSMLPESFPAEPAILPSLSSH